MQNKQAGSSLDHGHSLCLHLHFCLWERGELQAQIMRHSWAWEAGEHPVVPESRLDDRENGAPPPLARRNCKQKPLPERELHWPVTSHSLLSISISMEAQGLMATWHLLLEILFLNPRNVEAGSGW